MLRHSSRMRELDDSTWPFRRGCPSQLDIIESQHPCQSLNHTVTRHRMKTIGVQHNRVQFTGNPPYSFPPHSWRSEVWDRSRCGSGALVVGITWPDRLGRPRENSRRDRLLASGHCRSGCLMCGPRPSRPRRTGRPRYSRPRRKTATTKTSMRRSRRGGTRSESRGDLDRGRRWLRDEAASRGDRSG